VGGVFDTATWRILANQAGIPGVFKAWLSDSFHSPSTRFTQSTGNYVRVDGAIIANGWSFFNLQNPINVDETGKTVSSPFVWTDTIMTGSSADPAGYVQVACSNGYSSWANSTASGRIGLSDRTDAQWTNTGTGTCDGQHHLYCFQQ
jgi:hypothetical protein